MADFSINVLHRFKLRKEIMHILIIVVLCLILYIRTMKFLLIADDLAWYLKNKNGWRSWKDVNWGNLKDTLVNPLYGGFTFGRNVSLDHLFSIFLHTVIAVMIYMAFGANDVSFWAAILYACNPINNQTSIWLNGRRYAINIILVLGMIMVSNLSHGWAYAGVLYWLTSFFQVTAIFAPILLVGKYPWIALGVALFVAYKGREIFNKVSQRYKIVHDDDRKKFTPKRLIIIVKVYGHYFFKIFFPGICAMTYPTLHFWGQTKEGNKDAYSINVDFIKGILAFICSGVILFLIPIHYRALAIFMVLSLLQWCAIIPIVQDLADRYAGVPTVFAMFFLSYFAHQYAGVYAITILMAFVAYYIPMLLTVMKMYHSEGARWTYQRYYFPQLPAPLKYEAEWLIHDQRNPLRAWVLIQEYLKYGGKDFTILFQAAKCHQAVYRLEEAKAFAKLATENYHVGHEEREAKMVETFLAGCIMPSGSVVGPVSRQVRRAEERKRGDKNEKSKQR